MSGSQVVLFACSRCFSRHPFEELSSGQQLCKECRGTFPMVKCTYCRTEFQQTSKGNITSICRKCEQNVKQYGKPTACEFCNIIAAFVGSKCQRCAHSEQKYGPAVTCDQCRQRCAFDRHDENKKIDGKLMCWLCTISYKRAVVKARQTETEHRLAKKRPSTDQPMKESSKKPHPTQTQQQSRSDRDRTDDRKQHQSQQQSLPDIGSGGEKVRHATVDHNSSEHVVAMTQLKEQIASLNKKLSAKDREILAKDKFTTELKSKNFISENELRTKMKDAEKYYEAKIDVLNKKVSSLLKEVAQLSKGNKRGTAGGVSNGGGTASSVSANASSSGKDSGGSGTDSPITN